MEMTIIVDYDCCFADVEANPGSVISELIQQCAFQQLFLVAFQQVSQ